MKRLFLAVDIAPGPALPDAYDDIRHTLRMEKINWVRKDQMHLTLAFLGDTEEDMIPDLVSGIETVINVHHSFKLTLTDLAYSETSMIHVCSGLAVNQKRNSGR